MCRRKPAKEWFKEKSAESEGGRSALESWVECPPRCLLGQGEKLRGSSKLGDSCLSLTLTMALTPFLSPGGSTEAYLIQMH